MTIKIDRLIRDGLVAVLYSPGFGAGWSTWDPEHAEALTFDPQIADIVDRADADWKEKVEALVAVKYPDTYLGGVEDLCVTWIPQGTRFRIEEYDGSESVQLLDQVNWLTA